MGEFPHVWGSFLLTREGHYLSGVCIFQVLFSIATPMSGDSGSHCSVCMPTVPTSGGEFCVDRIPSMS